MVREIFEPVSDFGKWLVKNGNWEWFCLKSTEAQGQRIYLDFLRECDPKKYDGWRVSARNRAIALRKKKDARYFKLLERSRKHGTKKRLVELLGGKCIRCGFNSALCALEFHHINPKDKWSNSTFSGFNQNPKRFEEDVKAGKILLLCSNCHKIEHFNKPRMHKKDFKYKTEVNPKPTFKIEGVVKE